MIKMLALCFICLASISEQAVEIYAVERSHFHYSMDVYVAVVITFLMYTNGAISLFAKQWAIWGFRVFVPKRLTKDEDEDDDIPGEEVWKTVWHHGSNKMTLSTDPVDEDWTKFNSRGDIFIPICCVPFCTLAGREHLYSDENVKAIIKKFDIKKFEPIKTANPPQPADPPSTTIGALDVS